MTYLLTGFATQILKDPKNRVLIGRMLHTFIFLNMFRRCTVLMERLLNTKSTLALLKSTYYIVPNTSNRAPTCALST